MNFAATENSKIYLLAIDKRLKFLRDGNDITKDDVSAALGDHQAKGQLVVDDFSSWTACSEDELDRVGVQFNNIANEGTNTMPSPKYNPESLEAQDEPSVLRQDFPETWIFESFEMGSKNTAMKEFTAPDAITTWVISAFSLNPDKGLAIAPTQELKVMNEFFIKMDLPHSIKFLEVLRIDILVFNFVQTQDFIKTEVKLENLGGKEFQFVEFPRTCTAVYNNKESSSITTDAFPYNSVIKVSFYIRSDPTNDEFDDKVEKKIKLKVTAIGNGIYGRTYQDQVQKELLVKPAGVSDFIIQTQDYKLDGSSTYPYINYANFTEELKSVHVIVGGDYMINSLIMSSRYE
jgi:hypothetical protein